MTTFAMIRKTMRYFHDLWRNCSLTWFRERNLARNAPIAKIKSPAVMRPTFQGSRLCPACARTALRLPRNAGRMLIWIYRHTLSPLVGFNCRHLPTCSAYGDEAIARFGLWGGGWMTLARILRCHPWGTSGIDNVPVAKPSSATWYRPWRYGRWRGVNAK